MDHQAAPALDERPHAVLDQRWAAPRGLRLARSVVYALRQLRCGGGTLIVTSQPVDAHMPVGMLFRSCEAGGVTTSNVSRLLTSLIQLVNTRQTWMLPMSTNIGLTAEQEWSLTTRWLLKGDTIRNAFEAAECEPPFLIPIHRSLEPNLDREHFRILTARGEKPLPAFHCQKLLQGDGDPSLTHVLPDSGFANELLVVINDPLDLNEQLELDFYTPLDQLGDAGRRGIGLSALAPVGLVQAVLLLDGLDLIVREIRLETPTEIDCDQVILRYDTGVAGFGNQLKLLATSYGEFTHPNLKGPIVVSELETLRELLLSAITNLHSAENRIRVVAGDNGEQSADVGKGLERLEGARTSTSRLLNDVDSQFNIQRSDPERALIGTGELKRLADGAARATADVHHINVSHKLQPRGGSRTWTVRPCSSLSLERLAIVFSTSVVDIRQRRLGAPFALWSLSLMLLAVGFTFHAREQALPSSKSTLVALLLIFPALMFTQIERPGRRNVYDTSLGLLLTAVSLGFFVPVGVALLVLGDASPGVLVIACLAGGGLLGGAALVVSGLFRSTSLARIRQWASRGTLERWPSVKG